MNRLLLFVSLICLVFLGIGTVIMPNNNIFWLASSMKEFQIFRTVLGFILIVQLITSPPRHQIFRFLVCTVSIVALVWTLSETYDYHMGLLDTLVFIGSSVVIFVTALESRAVLTIKSNSVNEIMTQNS